MFFLFESEGKDDTFSLEIGITETSTSFYLIFDWVAVGIIIINFILFFYFFFRIHNMYIIRVDDEWDDWCIVVDWDES